MKEDAVAPKWGKMGLGEHLGNISRPDSGHPRSCDAAHESVQSIESDPIEPLLALWLPLADAHGNCGSGRTVSIRASDMVFRQ